MKRMRVLIVGAAGFIGTNLALELSKNENNQITLADVNKDFFVVEELNNRDNVELREFSIYSENYTDLLENQDIVFHLVSTTNPTSSNSNIEQELNANISFTTRLLEQCTLCKVKKIIFISSGGTVYGNAACPVSEESMTNPISAYGIQKLTIEKILFLYHYLYGLDYKIIRLANPYGPYQRPNGRLGALTTFTYKALKQQEICVFGDGSVVRDYIYIEDAVKAILNISFEDCKYHIYNVGSGVGISICDLLSTIQKTIGTSAPIKYLEKRKVDLKENYLDVHRYEKEFGPIVSVDLEEGIRKTASFLNESDYVI